MHSQLKYMMFQYRSAELRPAGQLPLAERTIGATR
jgi:hypothetical protein